MTPVRRLVFCALAALLSACAQQAQPDIADTDPIKPDQDPWERVGATMT